MEKRRFPHKDEIYWDKTLKIFTPEEGGSEHCQGDNLTLGITYIADWLSDKLRTR